MLAIQGFVMLVGCVLVCQAFIGSGDEAYMKKYAIRKVWESCFGSEVVKQIRQEKRAAIAKCRAQPPGTLPAAAAGAGSKLTGQLTPAELALVLAAQQAAGDKMGQAGSIEGPEPRPESSPTRPSLVKDHFPPKKRPGFNVGSSPSSAVASGSAVDINRLQALLSYKAQQNGYLQPQAYQPSSQQYNPFLAQYQANGAYQPSSQQYQHSSPYGQFPGSTPGFAYNGNGNGYQAFPSNAFYGQPQTSYPFYQPQPQQPFYSQQAGGFYGRQRPARELTLQSQLDLEALHRAIGAKTDNVSCQLQELGYLDENLEPAYEKISLRLKRLPVEEELKRDMLDGLEFCKRFSQCMPDMRKDAAKFSQDQDKQMFFFSCYKHKKLEACLMKDVRERFLTDDPLTQDEIAAEDLRSLPRGRKAKMPDFKPKFDEDKFDDLFVRDTELYFV